MNDAPQANPEWCDDEGNRGSCDFCKGFAVLMVSVPAPMDKHGFDRLDILHAESVP